MSRVLVTGSTDGLGLLAAKRLAQDGHSVTLHARNESRAADARREMPQAEGVVIGDFASVAGMRRAAEEANRLGSYEAVIHNAGVYGQAGRRETTDGLELVFSVNVLAPYVLTALVTRPERLVYLSSGMHRGGEADLSDPQWEERRWDGAQAYSNSKLYDVVLAFAVARHWPEVRSNALEPGWVPTKMGGAHAPDDLALGAETQAWLAVSDEPAATITGGYFYRRRAREVHPAARDRHFQDELLAYCAAMSQIAMPR